MELVYDINCVRCRVKMQFYFMENVNKIPMNEWLKHMVQFDLKDNEVIYDRLDKL